MSEKERIPLAEAERIAAELVEMLRPACERIEIAGSIRRRKADVGDIELLAIPRIMPVRNLLGEPAASIDKLDLLCRELVRGGVLTARGANGRSALGPRYKRLAYQGFPVDLFSVLPPAQFGVLFLIRTGPAEFSRRFVTHRRRGGMLPEWLVVREGALWQRMPDRLLKLVDAPEEGDVFRLLSIDYIPPEARR